MKRFWWLRAAVVFVSFGLAAAACGDDDDSAGGGDSTAIEQAAATTASTAPVDTTTGAVAETTAPSADTSAPAEEGVPEDVDPEGVLNLPWNLQQTPPNYDPANPTSPSPNISVVIMVYDTLLRPTGENGALEPGLAREVEYVDASTVHIVLQEGVTFTDGTPFDAEAVKTGIEYVRDSESTVLSAERKAIETITVDGPLELTLDLSQPVAGELINLMAWGDFLIASPKAIAEGVDLASTPVGAGPFMLEEYRSGERITLVKNPDYFQADHIKLAGVNWIHTPVGEALVTSLASGIVDVGEGVPYQLATQLENAPVEVNLEITDNVMLWGQMCKSRPPFDDLRVRQALNYGIDRDALNTAIYGDLGAPMWGFWAEDNGPYYLPELKDYYAYDPERARSLLAEAGLSELAFDMFFTPGVSDRAAEVLQAQWADIGVTVSIKPLTNPTEFFPDATGAPINFFPLERSGIQKVARVLIPGSVGNVCNWDDPELNEAVNAVRAAEPGTQEAIDGWATVQRRVFETAANVFGLFGVRAEVFNPDRVGNATFMPNFQGRPTINYYDAYIKQ